MKTRVVALLGILMMSAWSGESFAARRDSTSGMAKKFLSCLTSLAAFENYQERGGVRVVPVFQALPWSHRVGGVSTTDNPFKVWVLDLDTAAKVSQISERIILSFAMQDIKSVSGPRLNWVLIRFKGKLIALQVENLMGQNFYYSDRFELSLDLSAGLPELKSKRSRVGVDTFNFLRMRLRSQKNSQPFESLGYKVDAVYSLSFMNEANEVKPK